MITTHKSNLIARCKQRGYTLAEVMPCVVSQDNDQWTIDIDHPAYPSKPKPDARPPKVEEIGHGPGTELKALLKRFGIVASPGCSCTARAKLMDANEFNEPGWCEKNLETICDWLQEEATKRKLPFLRMAGKILVRKAIRNARKKGQ
jgi:hypothetical protein